MDWYGKYGEKLKFFELAEKQGVKIKAYEELPDLTPAENEYFQAVNLLAGAGYSDISAYCKDLDLNLGERADLVRVLLEIKSHQWRKQKNADRRTNTRQQRRPARR